MFRSIEQAQLTASLLDELVQATRDNVLLLVQMHGQITHCALVFRTKGECPEQIVKGAVIITYRVARPAKVTLNRAIRR